MPNCRGFLNGFVAAAGIEGAVGSVVRGRFEEEGMVRGAAGCLKPDASGIGPIGLFPSPRWFSRVASSAIASCIVARGAKRSSVIGGQSRIIRS